MKTKYLSTTAKKAKRGRARANKTKANAPLPPLPKEPAKKRGRPPGSKNKAIRPEMVAKITALAKKRSGLQLAKPSVKDRLGKRAVGRPKGGGVFKGDIGKLEFGVPDKKARKERSDKGVKRGARKVRGDTTNPDAPTFAQFKAKRVRGDTTNPNAPSFASFKAQKANATAVVKKARKVRSDKGVKRGPRTKVI